MRKLSFKQYLESKEKLRKAISETPVVSTTYTVRKYCKLRLGESKDHRKEVALKPRQRIIVEWQYDDLNDPKPLSVVLDDVSPVEHSVYWAGSKLRGWLSKNAIEEML